MELKLELNGESITYVSLKHIWMIDSCGNVGDLDEVRSVIGQAKRRGMLADSDIEIIVTYGKLKRQELTGEKK